MSSVFFHRIIQHVSTILLEIEMVLKIHVHIDFCNTLKNKKIIFVIIKLNLIKFCLRYKFNKKLRENLFSQKPATLKPKMKIIEKNYLCLFQLN